MSQHSGKIKLCPWRYFLIMDWFRSSLAVRPDPQVVDIFFDAKHQWVLVNGFWSHPGVLRVFRVEDHHAVVPAVMVEPDQVDAAVVGIPHGSQRLDQFDTVISTDLFLQFADGALLGGLVRLDVPGGEAPQTGTEFQLRAAFQQQEFMPVIFQYIDREACLDFLGRQNSSSASAMILPEPA